MTGRDSRRTRYDALVRGAIVLLVCLPACGEQDRRVDVFVNAGDQPQAGAVVIFHRADGERIGITHVDAMGHAWMVVPPDSLVTAVFPPDSIATRLVTVAATDGNEIVIHGPAAVAPEPIAGTLTITPTGVPTADDFAISVPDCGVVTATWPVSIELTPSCIGKDNRVPIVILARDPLGPEYHVATAYAAGEVVLDNGVATFAPADWHPMTPNLPVENALGASISMTLWSAGLPVGTDNATDGGLIWQGLTVEHASMRATIGDYTISQTTTREVAGSPELISFSPDDFLPAIPRTLIAAGLPTKGRGGRDPLHFWWEVPDLEVDVLELGLGYLSPFGTTVMWTVVLPPDATAFTTPRFEDELELFTPRDDPSTYLRYIDSPEVDGYGDARDHGVNLDVSYAPSTIVPALASGQLRESWTIGY